MTEDTGAPVAVPEAHPATLPTMFYNTDKLPALFAALSAAQGAYKTVVRDKLVVQRLKNKDTGAFTGGTIEFKYAELAQILDATRDALAANGLTFLQPVDEQAGIITIHSILAHKDGGMVIGRLPVTGTDMKNFGGNITFLRRYAAGPILGVASEDDADEDGQPAEGRGSFGDAPRGYTNPAPARAAPKPAAAKAKAPAAQAPAPAPAPAQAPAAPEDDGQGQLPVDEPQANGPSVSEGQAKWIANKIEAAGWSPDEANKFLAKYGPYNVKNLAAIAVTAFDAMRAPLAEAAS